ncbi:MAG: hypothetical protein AAF648_04300 [Pseudomonadota bacterium]
MTSYREQFRARERQRREWEARLEAEQRKSGHGRPRSRREFLNRGLRSATATVFLPSIATLFSRYAYGECVIDNNPLLGAGKIPFLVFDQGGGANIAGSNIMVGGAGGQEDFISANGYARLGLPEAIIPQNVGIDRTFGLAMHPNSALLRGMLSKTSAGTRANVNGSIIPARSENDTGNNPHNPIYGVARAGADGEFVATIGTRGSDSGGRSRAPDSMIDPTFRPSRVRNRNDVIGLGGGDDDTTPNARIAQASAVLTALKLDQINEAQARKELVQCGFDKTTATFNTPITSADLDPNQDAILQDIFPGDELTDGDFVRTAATLKSVVNGFAGAGTIEYGGRDYHQDPRPETDGKDFVVGQAIGASLEYAARLNKPLMIYGISDGSVVADTNRAEDDGNGVEKYRWRSDNSQTAASFFLVYSPAGQPTLRNGAASQQLGTFTMDGNVDTSATPFANSVTTLSELAVLNYLALHGEQARFGEVLGNPGLGTGAAVDPFVVFDPIV